MSFRYAISLVLEAHLPFVRDYKKNEDLSQSGEEGWFFEAVSETYLPLLETLDRLEGDRVPFRLGLSISPLLCQMLADEYLMKKYLFYVDKQIEFGRQEIERTAGIDKLNDLAVLYYNRLLERRYTFTERYEGNILNVINSYRVKGKIEILAGSATHAFLPFFIHSPEAMQAQLEVAISCYRRYLGGCPQGFWLPELGWASAVGQYLRAYNFCYTIIDSHGLLYGKPLPPKGSFYPVKTSDGIYILARDFFSAREIEKLTSDTVFRDNDRDAGYELSPKIVGPFLSVEGERRRTGFKYWQRPNANGENMIYDSQVASHRADEYAGTFLKNSINRLKEAAGHMDETPLILCAHNADDFGRFWYEGPQFIEALFRKAAGYPALQFLCPTEYIYGQNLSSFQLTAPEYSSWGFNGYAETWLDVSNDWMYRHLARSIERMTELAERFPDETGLKERALNQATREILLAQSSDWSRLLFKQDSTEFARSQAENSLRNFTTIYEALGSNYISTEWLTRLERRHNFFPNINYRVFRRKK
jgi:1,4-alpha-glucan branching enzyme